MRQRGIGFVDWGTVAIANEVLDVSLTWMEITGNDEKPLAGMGTAEFRSGNLANTEKQPWFQRSSDRFIR